MFDERFEYCFNSYYESVGPRQPAAKRGLLTRPSARRGARLSRSSSTRRWRGSATASSPAGSRADRARHQSRAAASGAAAHGHPRAVRRRAAQAGLSPDEARHRRRRDARRSTSSPSTAASSRSGTRATASPTTMKGRAHEVLLHPFKLANRCVTNGEWIEFIEDGGYATPTLWLADGWNTVKARSGLARSISSRAMAAIMQMSLQGFRPVDPAAPVTPCQLLRGRCFRALGRLPAADRVRVGGSGGKRAGRGTHARRRPSARRCRPRRGSGLQQMFGDVWEWTASAYLPYPGFKAAPGAVGEYNGKFMCNQFVLKGRLLRDAGRPYPADLSQFLLSPSALAVHRPAPGRRGVMEGDVSLQLPQGSPAPAESTRAPQTTAHSEFADAVLAGFARSQRSIPCRFFYDARRLGAVRGDHQARRILPDPRRDGAARSPWRGDRRRWRATARVLVEFGSGSSRKTSLLLGALDSGRQPMFRSTSPQRACRRLPRGCRAGMTGSPSCR